MSSNAYLKDAEDKLTKLYAQSHTASIFKQTNKECTHSYTHLTPTQHQKKKKNLYMVASHGWVTYIHSNLSPTHLTSSYHMTFIELYTAKNKLSK